MSFKTLLYRSLATLAVGAVLVTLCYFFVDRQVAYSVHNHHLSRLPVLKWLTITAMVFNGLAPILIMLCAIKLAWSPLTRLQTTLFAASVNLMLTVGFEYYLKFLFGRYWPDTWIHKNPSLIENNAYGFHPFNFGPWYDSFPSGHTARVVAVMSVFWLAYPRWRWFCLLVIASVVVGLVGMNYHFVGDTIGGVVLGGITGMYTARFFRLDILVTEH